MYYFRGRRYPRCIDDPASLHREKENFLALEDYFCARSWLALALGELPENIRMWLTSPCLCLDRRTQAQPKRLLALARAIEPFAPDPAQVGWWLVCHHFCLGTSPAAYLLCDRRGRRKRRVRLVELARDDFLDGSRSHRQVTPALSIPPRNKLSKQIRECPWYLLDLPNHPTLEEKRSPPSSEVPLPNSLLENLH